MELGEGSGLGLGVAVSVALEIREAIEDAVESVEDISTAVLTAKQHGQESRRSACAQEQ